MKIFNFTEAAAYAGVNVKTIHKHVRQGKIEVLETPLGRRISEDALAPYREHLKKSDTSQDRYDQERSTMVAGRDVTDRERSGAVEDTTVGNGRERLGPSNDTTLRSDRERLGMVDHTVGNVRERLTMLDDTKSEPERSGTFDPNDQALALMALKVADKALERARELEANLSKERERGSRAERRADALAVELAQYRRALSEQADSLAEERARRQTLEAREIQLQNPPLESLKFNTAKPAGASWGRRIKSWLGLGRADQVG